MHKGVLGCGANGCVFLLTNNAIIKILFSLESFNKEMENNDTINSLANTLPFFPKFKCMMQRKIETTDIGIIVSEKLEPISLIFDFTNSKFKIDPIQFYSQLWYIYYMIYEYYKKTKIIILHNDIKIDNFMLREIIDNKLNYKKTTIPYITIGSKRYILTLIDFGEAFIFNSTDIESFNQNFQDKISENIITLYKYELTDDGTTINKLTLSAIYNNLESFINKIAKQDILTASYFDNNNKKIFTDPQIEKIFTELTTKFK